MTEAQSNPSASPIFPTPPTGRLVSFFTNRVLFLFPLIYSLVLVWPAVLDRRLEAQILVTVPMFVLALLSLLGVVVFLNRINKVSDPIQTSHYLEKFSISVLILIFGYSNLVCLSQVSWDLYFGHIAITLMLTGYIVILVLIWMSWTARPTYRPLWVMGIMCITILAAVAVGDYEGRRYEAQNRLLNTNRLRGNIISLVDCDAYTDSFLKEQCLEAYSESAAKSSEFSPTSGIDCPAKLDKVSVGCYAARAARQQDFGQCDNSEFLKQYVKHNIAPSLQLFANTYALPNETVACKFLLALEPATNIWKDYYKSLPLQVVRGLINVDAREMCNKMNVGARCDAIMADWLAGGHSLNNPVKQYELSNTYTFDKWSVRYPSFPIKSEDFKQEDKRQRYEQGIYQAPNTMPARLALYVDLRSQVLNHVAFQDSGSSVLEVLHAASDGDNVIRYLLTAEQSSKPVSVKLITELPMIATSGLHFTAKIYQTYPDSYVTIYEFQDSGTYMFVYADKEMGYQIAEAITK